MLRIGKMTEYAILVLGRLALAQGDVRAVAQLAAETSLPGTTVAKVLKKLAGAGLVASRRGSAGGYVLEKPAAEVSVESVISAMEGPVALTACLESGHDTCACAPGGDCPLRRNWSRVNDAIAGALGGVSLADLMGRAT